MSDVGNVKIARWRTTTPPYYHRKPAQTLASPQTTGKIPIISSRFWRAAGRPSTPPQAAGWREKAKRWQARAGGTRRSMEKLSLEHDTRDRTPCWSTLRRRVQLRRLSHEGAARAPANRKGCALTPPARFDQPVPFGHCAFVCQEPRRAGATRRWRPTPASACCRAGLVRASSSARRKVG
jgi:hypothetical protein